MLRGTLIDYRTSELPQGIAPVQFAQLTIHFIHQLTVAGNANPNSVGIKRDNLYCDREATNAGVNDYLCHLPVLGIDQL